MKDLYTFDLTEAAALKSYGNIRAAYRNFFHEIGVPFLEVGASSGNMGGTLSHEFHFPSPAGEDTVLVCEICSYAANEEVVNGETKSSHKCPDCGESALSSHRAIEVGHTFHLGTRYSEPLNAVVALPEPTQRPDTSTVASAPDGSNSRQSSQQMVPLQMGCHGIGVSRLVGAIATMTADKKGLCWPVSIAPYHVVIVFDGPSLEEERSASRGLEFSFAKKLKNISYVSYSNFRGTLECVVDDRDKSLPWKLKDADLVGYPITVVLGRKWKETGEFEVQCRSRPELSRNSATLRTAVCEILNELSPPRDKPGWTLWYTGPEWTESSKVQRARRPRETSSDEEKSKTTAAKSVPQL
jgi:prolyl-tRNA synthetase